MTTLAVMWFRRDLRLADNPALAAALDAADEVVPLFVVDGALWDRAGSPRRAFLGRCLEALDHDLDGALVVRHGRPEHVIASVVGETGAARVFAAHDFGPYGRARDGRVAAALAAAGTALEAVGSPYAVPPGMVRSAAGRPYRVFGPFERAWRAHGRPPPLAAPRRPRWARGIPSEPTPTATSGARLPPAGERAALGRLGSFAAGDLARYAAARDLPALDATSHLSPYLKWGCIHPRQVLAAVGSTSPRFVTELCWREFYADVLHDDASSARRAWSPALKGLAVDAGDEADGRFAAWAEGRTGYPLVDAGMRQLLSEAWMPNRVRMVTASFLVKDLHLDWRRGARWFMRHLVDADVASNQHGWQWVAGTGTDASPFVRVFNPVTQSRRFDPDGQYIRRHVHELRGVPAPGVHEPWRLNGGAPRGYPAPIVDHAAERRDALARYEAVRRSSR